VKAALLPWLIAAAMVLIASQWRPRARPSTAAPAEGNRARASVVVVCAAAGADRAYEGRRPALVGALRRHANSGGDGPRASRSCISNRVPAGWRTTVPDSRVLMRDGPEIPPIALAAGDHGTGFTLKYPDSHRIWARRSIICLRRGCSRWLSIHPLSGSCRRRGGGGGGLGGGQVATGEGHRRPQNICGGDEFVPKMGFTLGVTSDRIDKPANTTPTRLVRGAGHDVG